MLAHGVSSLAHVDGVRDAALLMGELACSLTESPRWRTSTALARSQARSRTQLHCGLADADRLAGVDQQGALDPLLVEIGAVGRAEILDVPLAPAVGQPRMPRTGEVIGQYESGGIGPADEDRLVPERDLGAAEGAGRDHQGAGSALAALLGGGGPGWDGGDAAGAATEEVGPHHPESREDEQPQEQEKTEAEDLQDDLGSHPRTAPRALVAGGAMELRGSTTSLTRRPAGRRGPSGRCG